MIPKVKKAEYVEGYKLWLQFGDGRAGIIDLSEELRGPVFEPLKDVSTFQTFRVDPEIETLSWPNGADFAPEFLYANITVQQSASIDGS